MDKEKLDEIKVLVNKAKELEKEFADKGFSLYIGKIFTEDGIEVLAYPSMFDLESEKSELFIIINWKTRKTTLGMGKMKML